MGCEAALGGERLLRLLQLASPVLPVGAYSYSEGLETLVTWGQLPDAASLRHWMEQELTTGAMRLEVAVMARVYEAAIAPDLPALRHWNQWLSALREAEELRLQSWQMGRSLYQLLLDLDPSLTPLLEACGGTSNADGNFAVNFAVVYAIAAAHWQIDSQAAILAYLHSWASNLVNAGVKLIPLGQTAGQRLLLSLAPAIARTTDEALVLPEDDFGTCSWGQAIACMVHETLYTRLFRS